MAAKVKAGHEAALLSMASQSSATQAKGCAITPAYALAAPAPAPRRRGRATGSAVSRRSANGRASSATGIQSGSARRICSLSGGRSPPSQKGGRPETISTSSTPSAHSCAGSPCPSPLSLWRMVGRTADRHGALVVQRAGDLFGMAEVDQLEPPRGREQYVRRLQVSVQHAKREHVL